MIKSPKGGFVNVALADPSSLSSDASGYLLSKQRKSWVVSTLLGQTTHFSASDIRQICIAPFAQGWHRFAAVLAKVYGQDVLFFQSFRGGITFSTNRFKSSGLLPGRAGKRANGLVAPIPGSALENGVDSTYCDVTFCAYLHFFSSSYLRWAREVPAQQLLGETIYGRAIERQHSHVALLH